MAERHLDEAQASALARGHLGAAEIRTAVRHLLRGCGSCSRLIREMPEWGGRAEPAPAYERAVGRAVWYAAAATEDEVGESLWVELERLRGRARRELLDRSPDHRSLGVLRAGLRATKRTLREDRKQGLDLAEFLTELAASVRVEGSALQDLKSDWRAEAALVLSRARLATGDYRGGWEALEAAEAFLAAGTGGRYERAMCFVQRASLLGEVGEYEQALAMLDRAMPVFRAVRDRNAEGKVLLHKAEILRLVDPARGLTAARQGLTLVEKDDARAVLSGRYSIAYCLNEMGQPTEAGALLDSCRELLEKLPEASVQLAVEWLSARVRLAQARTELRSHGTAAGRELSKCIAEAEQQLRSVRGEYLAHNFVLEAVLVTIDLVELLAGGGRKKETLQLAGEVLPVLQGLGLHRDFLALLASVGEATAEGVVQAETLQRLGVQVRRSWVYAKVWITTSV